MQQKIAARPSGDEHIRTTGAFLRVQKSAQHSWDEAVGMFAQADLPQHGQGMLTLLRINQHLSRIADLDDLASRILADTVAALKAQRGSIILEDGPGGPLRLRAFWAPTFPEKTGRFFSKTLAERTFSMSESLLCRDVKFDSDLVMAGSVQRGAMSSIICALLRTPRRRLGVLQLDRGPFQEPFDESELFLADAIAANVAVGIESAQLVNEQREQFVQTVTSLARAVNCRDQYTGDHTLRVTQYARLLADELNLSAAEKYQIDIGTPLHDIGKIGIDDAILRKPAKLTDAEYEIMKTHTIKGAVILESIAHLAPMIPIIRHHHERWDGMGYPDRLGQEQISRTARIVAVADAFDAMTSHRPYRSAMPSEAAYLELVRRAGTHFDPACVKAFLRMRSRIEGILRVSGE